MVLQAHDSYTLVRQPPADLLIRISADDVPTQYVVDEQRIEGYLLVVSAA